MKLSHEPSVEVTVTVTGQDTTDLELSGLSGTDTLTFSTTTWDDAQTVTVKAREDADAKPTTPSPWSTRRRAASTPGPSPIWR